MQAKMRGSDTSSFANARVWKNEPQAAAYLGYNNLADYRMFRFHHIVLDWYLVFQEFCHGRTARIPLSLLRDIEEKDTYFPRQIDAMRAKYPVENVTDNQTLDQNRDYIYATILLRLAEDIENLSTHSTPDINKQQQSTKRFELEAGLNIDNFKLPEFEFVDTRFPTLGPIEGLEEHQLEKYSRVNVLLKSLQTVLAPTKWKEAFLGTRRKPFERTVIDQASIPRWMRPNTTELNIPIQASQALRSSKPFYLRIDRSAKSVAEKELVQHEEGYLTSEDLTLPSQNVHLPRDPRDYPNPAMWRDALRRQLKFQVLRVDFSLITFEASIPERRTTIYSYTNPDQYTPWTVVQSIISSSGEDQPTGFVCRLRAIPEDEDFEYEFEGPTAGIMEDIVLDKENDIELRCPLTGKTPHPEATPEDGTNATDETSIDATAEKGSNDAIVEATSLPPVNAKTSLFEQVKRFMVGSQIAKKREARPQAYFEPTEVSEMLEYHDEYDVFTEEGLLAWQHFVLDRAAGQITRPKNPSSMPMAKSTRDNLDALQTKSNSALISADVSCWLHPYQYEDCANLHMLKSLI